MELKFEKNMSCRLASRGKWGNLAAAWMGLSFPETFPTMTIFVLPAGGFFVLGIVIAVVSILTKKKAPAAVGCAGCPNASACSGACGKPEEKEA